MSRYIKDVEVTFEGKDHPTAQIAYGFDHALGYWLDLLVPGESEDIFLFQSNVHTMLTTGKMGMNSKTDLYRALEWLEEKHELNLLPELDEEHQRAIALDIQF